MNLKRNFLYSTRTRIFLIQKKKFTFYNMSNDKLRRKYIGISMKCCYKCDISQNVEIEKPNDML